MPDVIGLNVIEAQDRVLSAGRNSGASSARAVIVSRRNDARPAGQIIEQLNKVGTPMRPYMDDIGGTYGEVQFSIVLSTGPPLPATFPMPNVIGRTIPEAQRMVFSAGRRARASSARAIVVDRRADERPAGVIIEQRERAGRQMRPNLDDATGRYSEVTFGVVVSTGPEVAPDFIGKSIDTAQLQARKEEVILEIGRARPNPEIKPGTVLQQTPEPGQQMQARRVTVYLSAGYPLPDYVTRPLEDARVDARRLGFGLQQEGRNMLEIPRDVIFEQYPRAGTLLPLDVPVKVLVSSGWPVPAFTGMQESEANQLARENRIRLKKAEQDNLEVPMGVIFSQQPTPRDLIPPDRTVSVTISRGYPLPDLTGKHEREARQLASELGFSLDIRREPIADRRAEHVDRQSPEPDTRLPLDRPVNIVVSDGWPTPHFLTLRENQANSLAAQKDVKLTIAERRQDREAQPGMVIGQDPLPGAALQPGQAVSLVLSSGYPTPRFVGTRHDDAISLAGRVSIILDKTTQASPEFPKGVVSQQHPDPGSPLPADNRVSITISSGWPTPDFLGKSEDEAQDIARDGSITLALTAPGEHFEILPGLVIAQQPPAGTVIPTDRRVSITLSLGWPMAPAAVGKLASSVRQEFLARHPNAVIDASESIFTLEPTGTVISQYPKPNVKLDRRQQLKLVASANKPFWIWPATGLFTLAAAFAAVKMRKPDVNFSNRRNPVSTDDLGGIRLRVTKDHGIQATDSNDDNGAGPAGTGQAVKIKVNVDLGEQSAGPVEDKGKKL